MNGSCHCGRVTIRLAARPDYLNACNCSACTKLGTLWGYFPIGDVAFDGERKRYMRGDFAEPRLGFDFCDQCGATTNWFPLRSGAPDRMGVNMRLFDPAELVGIEVRYGNRRDHDGVEPRHYYREPTVFDGAGAPA